MASQESFCSSSSPPTPTGCPTRPLVLRNRGWWAVLLMAGCCQNSFVVASAWLTIRSHHSVHRDDSSCTTSTIQATTAVAGQHYSTRPHHPPIAAALEELRRRRGGLDCVTTFSRGRALAAATAASSSSSSSWMDWHYEEQDKYGDFYYDNDNEQDDDDDDEQEGYWHHHAAANATNLLLQDVAPPSPSSSSSFTTLQRDLAQRIWYWEQHGRRQQQPQQMSQPPPPMEYSVEQGLALVDRLVLEATGDDNSDQSDLVQEGLTALLDAMQHYRQQQQQQQQYNTETLTATTTTPATTTTTNDFEQYAEAQIRQALQQTYQDEHRSLRIPQVVTETIQKARRVALQWEQQQQQQQSSSRDPTTEEPSSPARRRRPTVAQVAGELGIPAGQLREYLRLWRATRPGVSVESTVGVSHPSLDDGPWEFSDQDDWEVDHGWLLDDGIRVHHDALVHEYIDETAAAEGDDQTWIVQQSQIAGPLTELIPDTTTTATSSSPDDEALAALIRHDVTEFLNSTLTPEEHLVIRSVFGLDTGRQATLAATGAALHQSTHQVSVLLAGGLHKLRRSYTRRYVEPYLESDPGRVADSV